MTKDTAGEMPDFEDVARELVDNLPRPERICSWYRADWWGPTLALALRKAYRLGRIRGRKERATPK